MSRVSRPVLAASLALVAALGVGACSHVPVTTLVKMRSFDPLKMDPAALRVAVQADERLVPQKGGAKIHLSLWFNGEKDKAVEHVFVLEDAGTLAELERLRAFAQEGRGIHAFRLSPADAARLRVVQEDARSRAGQTRNNGVTLNVEVKSCHRGALPAGPLLSNTYIRTELSPDYLLLLSNIDLRAEVAKHGKVLDEEVPPC